MANGNGTILDTAWAKWLQFILQALVLPLIGVIILTLVDHDRAITVIKSNRYTATDALRDQTAILSSIADLNLRIATLPPETFRKRVTEIEERVRQLELKGARARRGYP